MDEPSNISGITANDQNLFVLLVVGLLAMLLLSLLVIFFFVFYRKRFVKQEQKLDFYQHKLLDAEIIVQENERSRIARDLHDVVGSILSATKMFVGKLDPSLEELRYRELKKETSGLIDESIQNIRQIIYDIIPIDLEQFGLISVVENLFESYAKAYPTRLDLRVKNNSRLPVQDELAIYRIIQELTNNSLKYAEASEIVLEMNIYRGSCELSYTDDGKGFDINSQVKDKPGNKNLGLKSIRSRIAFLDADYTIKSSPGQGFYFHMKFDKHEQRKD